jgi:hypothetical protein
VCRWPPPHCGHARRHAAASSTPAPSRPSNRVTVFLTRILLSKESVLTCSFLLSARDRNMVTIYVHFTFVSSSTTSWLNRKKEMVKNWYVYKIISFVDFCTLISININSFIFILWFCMWQLKEMRSEILPPRTNTSDSRTIMWISIISGRKSKRRILFRRKKCG